MNVARVTGAARRLGTMLAFEILLSLALAVVVAVVSVLALAAVGP
jgi:hypothetical protein